VPLPPDPVFAPGTPEPLYCIEQSNHPFKLLVASIIVPGAANHIPAIPGDAAPVSVDILIEKLATTCLLNANVNHCCPVSFDLFGPTVKILYYNLQYYA